MGHEAILGAGDDYSPPLSALGGMEGEQGDCLSGGGGDEAVEGCSGLDPRPKATGLARGEVGIGFFGDAAQD